jgi:cation diffusion facilitator CzcD-associated flavoprotein CzcO
VANGHYSVPNIPLVQGLSEFSGIQLHTHDFRSITNSPSFKDAFTKKKVVCIIGSNSSGMDMLDQLFYNPQCNELPVKKVIMVGVPNVFDNSADFKKFTECG